MSGGDYSWVLWGWILLWLSLYVAEKIELSPRKHKRRARLRKAHRDWLKHKEK